MSEKEKPKSLVSFILPARNAAATLESVLAAVAQYDGQSHEIIVVDDGSTDRTAIVAERHATRVIRSDRSHGPADARSRAAKTARGQILFFLDSDIYVTTPMIKRIVALTRLHPECLGMSVGVSRIPLNKGFFPRLCALQESYYQKQVLDSTEATHFPYMHARFGTMRKTDFDAVNGFNPSFRMPGFEDIDLSLRLRNKRRFLYVADMRVRHRWPAGRLAMWRWCFRKSYIWARRIRPRISRLARTAQRHHCTGSVRYFLPLSLFSCQARSVWSRSQKARCCLRRMSVCTGLCTAISRVTPASCSLCAPQ